MERAKTHGLSNTHNSVFVINLIFIKNKKPMVAFGLMEI